MVNHMKAKKSAFLAQKNLIPCYSATFQLLNYLNLQKVNKIQLFGYGKIQAKQIQLLKLAVFGHFLIFSVFYFHFFKTLELKIWFFIHQIWDEISQMTNIYHNCTQNQSFKFCQKRNCPLSNALCLPPSSAIVSIWLTPPPPLVSNRHILAYPLPPLQRLT